MSTENDFLVAADSWEDANADPVGTLVEKMEKVKLLQRKEQKKEQFFEKVKSEDSCVAAPKLQDGGDVPVEEPKRVFLRRPKDGFTAETISDSSPESAESRSDIRDRQTAKNEAKKPSKTLEQRQADYQAARDRILGPSYKPDNQEIKEIKFIDRSKSPETLRMTQKNMVEHYGEELSRELMQQPVAPVVTQERQFVSDFSFQQPPPNVMMVHDGEYFNGPPGFPQGQPQHFHPMETHFYPQPMNNSQMPMHFMNQQNFQNPNQQFIPPDVPVVSSSSQNTQINGKNEQAFNYYQQSQAHHNQQQMNCVPYTLPNMSYPPPNMMSAQSNQMMQMQQQQNPPPFYNNTQEYPPKVRYQNQNGAGRGRGAPPMMYPMVNGAMTQPPPHVQQSNQYRAPQNGAQNRNAGGGQTRQFQSNQLNGQSHQNNSGNRRTTNRNSGKGGQVPPNFQVPPQGGNIIPFGCPPHQANAIREQYGMTNPGTGLLGAHPSIQHWTGPPQ